MQSTHTHAEWRHYMVRSLFSIQVSVIAHDSSMVGDPLQPRSHHQHPLRKPQQDPGGTAVAHVPPQSPRTPRSQSRASPRIIPPLAGQLHGQRGSANCIWRAETHVSAPGKFSLQFVGILLTIFTRSPKDTRLWPSRSTLKGPQIKGKGLSRVAKRFFRSLVS